MTPAIKLNSRTWTLRFKNNRTTILLHVDPLQQLSSVRAELLKSIQQTHQDGKLNGHAIPEDESEILLARPADINDLSMGWEPLDRDEAVENAIEEEKSSKGKGKASASKAKSSKDKLSDCPQGAGLRDGGVVAFKFRSQAEAERGEGLAMSEEEKLDGETLVGANEHEKWDVVVPTMEDSYPEGEPGEANLDDEIPVPLPKNAT